MGMYDQIRCERVLPVEGFEGHTFQTKAFQNVMVCIPSPKRGGWCDIPRSG